MVRSAHPSSPVGPVWCEKGLKAIVHCLLISVRLASADAINLGSACADGCADKHADCWSQQAFSISMPQHHSLSFSLGSMPSFDLLSKLKSGSSAAYDLM